GCKPSLKDAPGAVDAAPITASLRRLGRRCCVSGGRSGRGRHAERPRTTTTESAPGLDADAAVFARAGDATVDRARVPVGARNVAGTVVARRRDSGERACDERVALHLVLTRPRQSLRPHLLTDERGDAATVLGDGSAAPALRGEHRLDGGYRRRIAGLR